MDYQPLKYIYEPVAGAKGTLLMLHGTGADETDLIPLASYFGKSRNILSVRGNVMENGMPRFFRRISMGVFDEEDLKFRTHELYHFIRGLSEKESFDFNKLVVVGYSNGANIAGGAFLLYPDWLEGAVLFRPMQPLKEPGLIRSTRKQPIFFSSGKFDPTIDMPSTHKYANLLRNAGFEVDVEELPVGHNLTHDDLHNAGEWYRKHFPGE